MSKCVKTRYSTDSSVKSSSSEGLEAGPKPLVQETKDAVSAHSLVVSVDGSGDEEEFYGDGDGNEGSERCRRDSNGDKDGFISRVSTIIDNYHKESMMLNENVADVPLYDNAMFDPLSRRASVRTCGEPDRGNKSIEADEEESGPGIKDDGLYNSNDIIDPPPDGGYGWVCCACVVVMNFCTWGPNTCYGVFLSYYLSSHYFPGASPSDFAIIGGLMVGLTFFCVPMSAMLMNRFGYRTVMLCSVVLEAAAFVASSFVTTIGELYFTYGILLGVANGGIYGCNSIVIPGWFLKKRAFANGVTHVGVGLGGLVLTFIVHSLIKNTGSHKWALRFLGIMTLVLNTIAGMMIKIRVPKNPPPRKSSLQMLKEVYDIGVYKSLPLQYCTLWSSLSQIGYVILLFSLPNYALSIGLSSSQATATLALFNGGQLIGRPGMGYLSEKMGRVNFSISCMSYAIILIGPFWFNVKNYSAILAFAFLLGFGAGVCNVNIVPLVADVTGIAHFPAGLGYANGWNGGVTIIAEVIALKLRNYALAKPYLHCQIFVLVMYFVGTLCLIPYREWKVRRMLNAKLSGDVEDEKLKTKWLMLLKPGFVNYFKRAFYLVRC